MDELELIRDLRDDRADDGARERVRRDLEALMQGAPGAAPGARRAPRRPRRRWTLAGAGLAAACAIAVVVALVTGVDDAAIAPAPANAKQALERAANAAERRPERPIGAGEYFYVRERSAYLSTTADGAGYSAIEAPRVRETWIDRDGRGRIVDHDRTGEPAFVGPRDRARWVAAGRPAISGDGRGAAIRVGGAGGFTTGSTNLSYEELSDLPTGGETMYRKLIELSGDAGPSPDEEAFTIIADLLRTAPVPADVRAGLYRAAGYIEGVRYVGEVRDELGRPGLAIELTAQEQRRRLVFDPDTSQVLVEQDVLTKRVPYIDADPGFVTGYRLVLEQGVVKGDSARP